MVLDAIWLTHYENIGGQLWLIRGSAPPPLHLHGKASPNLVPNNLQVCNVPFFLKKPFLKDSDFSSDNVTDLWCNANGQQLWYPFYGYHLT